MVDPVADSIASVALVISIIAVVAGESRARKSKERERRLGPTDSIRVSITSARKEFETMVSIGGRRRDFFLKDENNLVGQHLRDLADQVGDSVLRSSVRDIANSWDSAFGNAPPSRIEILVPGTVNDQYRKQRLADGKRLDAQMEIARQGIEKCAEALKTVNGIWLS